MMKTTEEQGHQIQVVEMEPRHIETLEELEKECFSTPWSFDSLVSELSNPLAVFRVAEWNGEVAGYAGMQHIMEEGYICNIAVFPRFRRNGVATRLMETLYDYAKENDMATISLEVRDSNLAAQNFYRKFDFQVVGERKNFYSNPQENALIMTKTFGKLF